MDSSLFHPEAWEELSERFDYQRYHWPYLLDEWYAVFKSTYASILEDPTRHREREFGHRRAQMGKFPHYIAYIIRGDTIWIVAVGSTSQDPLYWKNRI